ncbi:MAG: hypothetical protein Q8R15_00050 [Candidatus Micrarchaeota archaeon]|nr:hypothetical protein [Candidatus Micrarchaeota archaeon]
MHEIQKRETPPTLARPFFPNKFKRPGKDWLNQNDRPTLAGKVIPVIYAGIVMRKNPIRVNKDELLKQCKKAKEDFKRYIAQVNSKRTSKFSYSRRLGDAVGFHHDNRKNPSHDHLLFFHHPRAEVFVPAKAYVTLLTSEADHSHKHFVDLCQALYDAGVHFVAKGTTPKGTLERTDNLIFYIDRPHRAKAAEVITHFLTINKIAEGKVPGSIASHVSGLSWAREPTREEGKLWQKITGSSIEWNNIGWNGVQAALLIPAFFEANAAAHRRTGNFKMAKVFNDEAARVRRLIEESGVVR